MNARTNVVRATTFRLTGILCHSLAFFGIQPETLSLSRWEGMGAHCMYAWYYQSFFLFRKKRPTGASKGRLPPTFRRHSFWFQTESKVNVPRIYSYLFRIMSKTVRHVVDTSWQQFVYKPSRGLRTKAVKRKEISLEGRTVWMGKKWKSPFADLELPAPSIAFTVENIHGVTVVLHAADNLGAKTFLPAR